MLYDVVSEIKQLITKKKKKTAMVVCKSWAWLGSSVGLNLFWAWMNRGHSGEVC